MVPEHVLRAATIFNLQIVLSGRRTDGPSLLQLMLFLDVSFWIMLYYIMEKTPVVGTARA